MSSPYCKPVWPVSSGLQILSCCWKAGVLLWIMVRASNHDSIVRSRKTEVRSGGEETWQ